MSCFLAPTFAGENAVAYCHSELAGIAGISGGNISLDMGQVLFCLRDLPWQVANFPTDMPLLIGVNGTQLVQLTNFRVDLDLFDDGRIA